MLLAPSHLGKVLFAIRAKKYLSPVQAEERGTRPPYAGDQFPRKRRRDQQRRQQGKAMVRAEDRPHRPLNTNQPVPLRRKEKEAVRIFSVTSSKSKLVRSSD